MPKTLGIWEWGCPKRCDSGKALETRLWMVQFQAPVVQTLDCAIHRINRYVLAYKGNQLLYLLDRDFDYQMDLPFEQLGQDL